MPPPCMKVLRGASSDSRVESGVLLRGETARSERPCKSILLFLSFSFFLLKLFHSKPFSFCHLFSFFSLPFLSFSFFSFSFYFSSSSPPFSFFLFFCFPFFPLPFSSPFLFCFFLSLSSLFLSLLFFLLLSSSPLFSPLLPLVPYLISPPPHPSNIFSPLPPFLVFLHIHLRSPLCPRSVPTPIPRPVPWRRYVGAARGCPGSRQRPGRADGARAGNQSARLAAGAPVPALPPLADRAAAAAPAGRWEEGGAAGRGARGAAGVVGRVPPGPSQCRAHPANLL